MYLFTKYYRTVTDIIVLQGQLQELRNEYSVLTDHWKKELKKIDGIKLQTRISQDTLEYKNKLKQEVGIFSKEVIDALF